MRRFRGESLHDFALRKSRATQRHFTAVRRPTVGRPRKVAVTGRLGSVRTTSPGEGRGETEEGLSWHEKILMRRARNAAASRNRRRLKKLGVLTRSKRRHLVTQARTTEDEAAAAALQASPQEAAPPSKTRIAKRKPGRPRLSKGVAVRRSGFRRILADADIDSEPPYVVIVNVESSPDNVRSSKTATSDQRRRCRRDSPGCSTPREARIDRRRTAMRRKDPRDVSAEKGSSQRKEALIEDEHSDVSSKTRSSRSMTRLTESPIKRHCSRDVASARDSRAKRRYNTSVDREGTVGVEKHSRTNRTADKSPSSSGSRRKENEEDSSPEVKRKRSRSRPQGEYK